MKAFTVALLIYILSQSAQAIEPRIEPLMGFYTSQKRIFLQVESGGCTLKDSFRFRRATGAGTAEITFLRVQPDRCLALMRDGQTISYTFEELGLRPGDRFQVLNNLGLRIVPGEN